MSFYRWGGDITDRDQPQPLGYTRSDTDAMAWIVPGMEHRLTKRLSNARYSRFHR